MDTSPTFDESFQQLFAVAYRVAYRLTGSPGTAEELAQEALARAYASWPRVAACDAPAAWVSRVAGNLAIDRWRRERRATAAAGGVRVVSATEGPDERRADLHRALARLPRRQREVIVLRYLADRPEADVASVLGCSGRHRQATRPPWAGDAPRRPEPRSRPEVTPMFDDLDPPSTPIPGPDVHAAVVERGRRIRRVRQYRRAAAFAAVLVVLGGSAAVVAAGGDDPEATVFVDEGSTTTRGAHPEPHDGAHTAPRPCRPRRPAPRRPRRRAPRPTRRRSSPASR